MATTPKKATGATGAELRSRAMVAPDGERYYPEIPDEALRLNVEHGAEPEFIDLWQWPGVLTPFDVAAYCPAPEICFPNGVDSRWSAVTCVHGSTA